MIYIDKELKYLNFLNICNLEILRIETHLIGTNIVICDYRYCMLLLASCVVAGIVCGYWHRALLLTSCVVLGIIVRSSWHRTWFSASSCVVLGIAR
jgi:hypothetical protein